MTSTESDDELQYHLRELRADLELVKASLETAASTSIDRSTMRAWVDAEALLAHVLEVHFPRALALLGSRQPTPMAISEPRTGDAETLAAVARDARRLIASALAALPIDAGPAATPSGVASAAQASVAAHQMLAEMLDLMVRLAEASSDSGDPVRG
jgi:hypothetical protein